MVDMAPPRRPSSGLPNPTTGPVSSAPFNRTNYGQSQYNPAQVLEAAEFSPVPNPLGELHQPTYHFKLFLPPEDFTLDEIDPPHVIIAETGATGLNLTDVQIEAIVGPNISTRNTIGTRISMKIFEPFGARLPDVLFKSAAEMKIKNYTKAPWVLELHLKGYDKDGNYVTFNNQAWRWQLLLLNIESKVSETGSIHAVEALPLAEHALTNQNAMLANAVAAKGNSVGEILQGVIDQLNKEAAERYGDKFLEYTIEDRPYTGSTTVASPFMHSVVSSNPEFDDARNQGIGQFSPGTDIPQIVDMVMAASRTAVEQARLSRKLNIDNLGEDPEATEITNVNSILHRVETKVEITGFNRLYGEYTKKITYIIRPYETVRLITSAGNAEQFMQNRKLQVGKVKYSIDNFHLAKMYDYLYTGTNTEVETFDININFNWTVAVPLVAGHLHYGTVTVPKMIDGNNRISRVRASVKRARETIARAREKINTVEDQDRRDQLNRRVDSSEDRVDNVDRKLKTHDNELNTVAVREESYDVDGEYIEAILDDVDSKLVLPLSINQEGDRPGLASSYGVSSQAHEGRSIYGSLLNQMYGAFDGNMQNIELQIRGDPYWLGPVVKAAAESQGDSEGTESTGTTDDPISTREAPAFNTAEHMFIFRYKIPLGERDDIDGDSKSGFGTSDTYTGFYATTKVIHSFTEGKFTQTLTGMRVMGWDVEEMLRIKN